MGWVVTRDLLQALRLWGWDIDSSKRPGKLLELAIDCM